MTNTSYTKIVRKLLATTSILALIDGSASVALGRVATTGGNEAISVIGTWDTGVAPVDNDSILLDADDRTLNFDRAGAVIEAIDLGGFNPGAFAVTRSVNIGSIGNGGLGKFANFTVANGQNLTLTGTAAGGIAVNTYTGLGGISLGAGSNLIIDADIAFAGAVNRTAGGAGVANMEINANKNVTLSGAIGTMQPITLLKLGANATLDLQADFLSATAGTAIELGDGSEMKITGARKIQGTDGNQTIDGAADDKGTLIFTGGNSELEEIKIGHTHAIHELRIASAHKLTTDSSITATEINFTGDGVIETAGNITGAIDNRTGVNGAGTLNLVDNLGNVVKDDIGSTHSLKAINAGRLVNNDENVTATLQGSVIKADIILLALILQPLVGVIIVQL
jgi:hypothetical protein